MSHSDTAQEQRYLVVVNHEEQYSIWPEGRDLPAGWRDAGKSGTKDECLAHINEVWTDMRPLSLRKHMEEVARQQAERPAEELEDPEEDEPEEESLVARLSRGTHPMEVSLRPERTAQALKEAIERGYVFLRFTQTRGGTELGVRVDAGASDLSQGDFERRQGRIKLVGDLTLDYVPVRCVADIDVASLTGQGHLEVLQPSG